MSSSSSSSEAGDSAHSEPAVSAAAAKVVPLIEGVAHALRSHANNNGVEPTDFSKRKGCTCCPCFSFVIQCVGLATMGSFLFGFNLSLLNTALNTINIEFGWCSRNENLALWAGCDEATTLVAFMSTAVFIGAAVGSMTGASFLALGRRIVLLISMGIFCFGIVSSVVANSFSALLWARLVVGYGVGLVSVVSPSYLSEMTPKEKRGTYGVMHQLMITVGIFVAVLIGLPLESPEEDNPFWELSTFSRVWWRVMLGLGIIPTIICAYLLVFTYTHDTPPYYCSVRQYDDATNLLRMTHGKSDVSEELQEIIEGLSEAERAKKDGLSLFKALGQADYFHVILVGCLLSAFQQFSGINVFIASSNALFEEAGFEGAAVTGFSVALTGVNVLMTFPSLYLIEALGRKTLLMIGTLGQTVGTLPAAISYYIDSESDVTSWLAIAGSIVFICFFAVAYGPVLWVYLFEIYPAEIRSAAAGAATAMNWIAGIVMVFVTNYVTNTIAYTLFAVLSFTAFLIVLFMVRETRGRSIEDSPYLRKRAGA